MSKSVKLKDNTYWDSKGITHNHKLLSDILYPIGSIYMSVNNVSPATLFGGTWSQISGRFLYCTTTSKTTGGSTSTGASTGNTGSTTLNVNQIPKHTHNFIRNGGTSNGIMVDTGSTGQWGSAINQVSGGVYTAQPLAPQSGEAGGGQGHTHSLNSHTHTQNLPPYFTVYCWYRTA